MGGVVELSEGGATGDGHQMRLGIDADAVHQVQVDDEAAVDAAQATAVVTATADGEIDAGIAREPDACGDVGDVDALRDERRPLVDHGVEQSPGVVIRPPPPDR